MINNLTKQKLISLIAESLLKEDPPKETKAPTSGKPPRKVTRKGRLKVPPKGGEGVPPSQTTEVPEVPATDDAQKPEAAAAAAKADKIADKMANLYYQEYLGAPSREASEI